MVGKRLAAFSHWVGKNKLRYFSGVIVIVIIFDQLFGYLSDVVLGWSRPSWSHSVFFGVFMALVFTIYRETMD